MKIRIKDLVVESELIYKPKNKNLYFKYRNQKLYVTVNKKKYIKNINEIIESNKDSLYKYIKKSITNNEKNNTIHFFGKEYECIFLQNSLNKISIEGNAFFINSSVTNKLDILNNFFKNKLSEYVNSIYKQSVEDFSDLHINPIIDYKNVSTYFGKCIPKKKLIYLNINLARYDKIYIKNVLYHELCHFKYLNHQLEFYNYFNTKIENAKKIQCLLKKIRYNDLY